MQVLGEDWDIQVPETFLSRNEEEDPICEEELYVRRGGLVEIYPPLNFSTEGLSKLQSKSLPFQCNRFPFLRESCM